MEHFSRRTRLPPVQTLNKRCADSPENSRKISGLEFGGQRHKELPTGMGIQFTAIYGLFNRVPVNRQTDRHKISSRNLFIAPILRWAHRIVQGPNVSS